MDNLKVTLTTSLKVSSNQIIPAGKQYSGDPRTFPSWLIAEMDSGSSCLNILTLANTSPAKQEVVTSVEEKGISESVVEPVVEEPVVEEPVRRTRRSRIG